VWLFCAQFLHINGFPVSKLRLHRLQVTRRRLMVRVEPERGRELIDGSFSVAQLSQQTAQVVVDVGVAGVGPQGDTQMRHRAGEQSP